MKTTRTIALLTTLFFYILTNLPVFAGAPLNDLADYQKYGDVRRHDGTVVKYPTAYEQFAGMHDQFAIFLGKKYNIGGQHQIDMVFPETDRKAMRLAALGPRYQRGTLFFLQFPKENDGVYISNNEQGYIDALLIEVSYATSDAVSFTLNEVLFSLAGALLTADMKVYREAVLAVIQGNKSYVDIWAEPLGKEHDGFYVRIMNVKNEQPFYRIAIFRP